MWPHKPHHYVKVAFSAIIRIFVSWVNIKSVPCTFLEFTFILSTNLLDYSFKLSILLHVYVTYSQLEIMKECCFSFRPMISWLSTEYPNFYYVWSVPSWNVFSGIKLPTGGNLASYIIRDSTKKAPSLCSTNDSGRELVLPYEYRMNRTGNQFYLWHFFPVTIRYSDRKFHTY
jgi:hypothetical protein